MSKVYRDSPIGNASHFNFENYADSLSKIILNKDNKTPFTVAINGKWGSGKTTLMRTLKNKLDESTLDKQTRKVKTVWFDAWKYSECDSMLAALIREILEEMERKGLLDKLKSKVLVGSEKIDVLKQMSDLAKILTLGNGPELEKWTRKTEYQNKLSFFDLFQDYMKTILQTFVLEKTEGKYTDNDGVMVIFIDDLDRCSPKNIASVLESINLFLDQEGCFFIIGTDISMIAKAIDAQYNGIKDFSGVDYIKKMIQLNFDLPLLKDDHIRSFIKDELKADSELDPYLDIIVKGLKGNQREIIRFLNSLNLMRILGESLKGELGYEEELLIKWNILCFSSPKFTDEIKGNQKILFEIQNIARMDDEKRDEAISNFKKEEGKEEYYDYCKNEKIVHVLSSGEEQFEETNIGTYLFLSSIAPKEIELDTSSHEYEIKPRADLRGADLREADLRGADLKEADLRGADLRVADLREANLKGANLRGADLRVADLRKASLIDADLREAKLRDANLKGAGLLNADLREADLLDAGMNEVDLAWANLKGANLTGASLIGADLLEVDLTGTDLTGSNLRGVRNLFVEQLSKVKSLSKAKLDNEILTNIVNTKHPLAAKVNPIDTVAASTASVRGRLYAGTDLNNIIGSDDNDFIEMNATNFDGFVFGEKLKVYGGSFINDRNIMKGGLAYETQIKQIDFESGAWGDSYNAMGLFGDKYIPLKKNTPDKLTKLLLDNGDKYTLRVGSALELPNGYELTAKQIDVSGDKVWMELSRNGEFIDDRVIIAGDKTRGTWIFNTNVADEIGVEVMRVHVTNIFQGQVDSLVVVEGLWLIDYKDVLEIEIGNKFGKLEVESIGSNVIVMKNTCTVTLSKDNTVDIAEGMKFKVADSNNLKFNLIRDKH
ncbi:pentapeptide repeat-containing protein [Methanolobus zinderi]|uniref:Pentapeptide repeat-containing protein n=1 Tax=Methanolobus zinderi TaxID=536044 RepID=A0A7D5I6A3_9EURY|nr:S-layer protein domain-containing protein [Methanolobus zinderi]QLC51103.1 pentapeptide repeat-containing protein [Methanolobus zinderi]